MRDTAGSAAALAARCKNWRRGSFILNLPLPSHHSITSSARASSVGGTVRPIAFAIDDQFVLVSWTGSPSVVPLVPRLTGNRRASDRKHSTHCCVAGFRFGL